MTLDPTLRTIGRNLPRVARSLGFQARVTSGYRSRAKQTYLYNRYLQGLQQWPVSPPGTSTHEYGKALDVISTNTEELVRLLQSVGLVWAGPADPVHFELPGYGLARKAAAIEAGTPITRQMGFWESFISSSKKIINLIF